MTPWKRDATVTYPNIYRNFKGKLKDGECKNYWIQDLTDEYKEEVVRIYVEGFLVDEPTCLCSGAKDDLVCVQEMSQNWTNLLNLNLSLICLSKDENGVTRIAGFNTLYVVSKGSEKIKMKSDSANRVISVMSYFETRKDPFDDFECDKYLSGFGLYVLPEFRKQGIAHELLSARNELCKSIGFKLTITFFSNPGSYIPAERAGFNDYVTMAYEDLEKIDKNYELPGIQKYSSIGKLMYKLYT